LKKTFEKGRGEQKIHPKNKFEMIFFGSLAHGGENTVNPAVMIPPISTVPERLTNAKGTTQRSPNQSCNMQTESQKHVERRLSL